MYRVLVDDNFDYMDEDDRWEVDWFATAEEASAACRALVDKHLVQHVKPGMAAAELYDHYVEYGDDPFIVTTPGTPSVEFSAWDYAKQRAEEICTAPREGSQAGREKPFPASPLLLTMLLPETHRSLRKTVSILSHDASISARPASWSWRPSISP